MQEDAWAYAPLLAAQEYGTKRYIQILHYGIHDTNGVYDFVTYRRTNMLRGTIIPMPATNENNSLLILFQ